MVASMREAAQELIAGQTPSSCVVIAELGVNHNGDLDRALALVRAALTAGADAVKLQLFEPSEICSQIHRAAELRLLESLRLPDRQHAEIFRFACECGMPVFATPFDTASLTLLCDLEIPLIKIGSGEVTHTPFLEQVARVGKPVVLSTGGCDWPDLDRAVNLLRSHSARGLSLLHCLSAYPPPDDELNLRLIPALTQRYPSATIGFSDHSLGPQAAVAAVSLGARIVEKHLTLDCNDDGPDHAASADPSAFAALVSAVRRVEAMLGDGVKRIAPSEGRIGRSIVAARDLAVGHIIAADDLAFKRPARGLRPYALAEVVGRRLVRAIPMDEMIHEADMECESSRIASSPNSSRLGSHRMNTIPCS